MGVHLYCIVPPALVPPAALLGVGAVCVHAASAGAVACWYSEHATRPDVDAAAVLAHNAVVQQAMSDSVTPVPLRFGQWFDELATAQDRIAGDAARWAAELERFAGCVEYGVHVLDENVPEAARDVHAVAAGSGTEYMAALARRYAAAEQRRAAAEAIASRLEHALAGVIRAVSIEYPETGGLVRCAYLVALERAADYHAVLARVRRSRSDLRFLNTGPWPPYSFVA